MTGADLSFTPRFILNVTPKYVRLTDGTDYSGLGEDVNYIYGNFKITTPNGVVMYNNESFDSNADIVGSSGTLYKDFTLPLDGEYVIQGVYTIEYTINIIDGVNTVEEYSKEVSYTYDFTEPTIAVTFTIDGYNSTFSCTESTTYADSAQATIVSRVLTVTPESGDMAEKDDTVTDMSSNPTVSYAANIYSGEYAIELVSTILYTMADDLEVYSSETFEDSDYAYKLDMNTLRDSVDSYLEDYYTEKGASGSAVLEMEENLMKMNASMNLYTLGLDYQGLVDAYNNILRIYQIIEGSTPTVAEIIPFENEYSFTNTDEKVKENSGTTASYLEDLIDNVTIEFSGGKIQVVGSLTDYVSKASGGTFEASITVSGVITDGAGGTSTNWNTAYTDRNKWDGGATGLVAANGRISLGLVIGEHVLAYDAGLQNLAGVSMVADKFYYTSSDNVHVAATVTSFARTILDDADASTVRATLGLVIGTDVLAEQTIGIANDNLLEIDGSPSSGEYGIFTANGITGITGTDLAAAIVGSIDHNSLNNLNVGSDYLHLSSAQKTIATQVVSGAQNGYMTAALFNTFNGKQDTMSNGTGITVSTNVISTNDSEIVHDNLNGFEAGEHSLLNDAGTAADEVWSASKINGLINSTQTTYAIKFDNTGSGALTDRVITNVPSGWTVNDSNTVNYGNGLGALATSLTIRHDKAKHGQVWVMIDDGSVFEVAQGNLAFADMKESSDLNAIELTTFCQVDELLEVVVVI